MTPITINHIMTTDADKEWLTEAIESARWCNSMPMSLYSERGDEIMGNIIECLNVAERATATIGGDVEVTSIDETNDALHVFGIKDHTPVTIVFYA